MIATVAAIIRTGCHLPPSLCSSRADLPADIVASGAALRHGDGRIGLAAGDQRTVVVDGVLSGLFGSDGGFFSPCELGHECSSASSIEPPPPTKKSALTFSIPAASEQRDQGPRAPHHERCHRTARDDVGPSADRTYAGRARSSPRSHPDVVATSRPAAAHGHEAYPCSRPRQCRDGDCNRNRSD